MPIQIEVNVNHYFHGTPDPRIDKILGNTETIKERIMTVNQKLAELTGKFGEFSTAVVAGLDNIKGDIEKLIANKSEMSPEDAATVDSLEAGFTSLAQKVADIAAIEPDAPTDPQPQP